MDGNSRRIALITGGQGGLAQALAARLRDSAYIVHSPGRDELDVTSAASVDTFFSGNKLNEGLDLLINNAGLRKDRLMLKMSEDDWDSVIDTNLKGAFLCSRTALKTMFRRRSGHIVNIGSFSALSGPAGQAAYAAAKAGLIALTKSIAAEGGRRNIRANCVLPGFLETKFIKDMPGEAIAAAKDRHVLGRFNTVSEAAGFINHLDQMTGVSGQVFQLDSRVS